MTDPTGSGEEALAGSAASLSARDVALADADRELVAALRAAHDATARAIQRLDAIHAEIESAVEKRTALDTAPGAREFQRFLLAKQREIIAIVEETHLDDSSKRSLIESLKSHYAAEIRPE